MKSKLLAISLVLGWIIFTISPMVWADDCNCENETYTIDADFDGGTLVNVNHEDPNNDQLQLDSEATPFGFIWVAVSSKGTVVKIDTDTGAVLGEYRTTPSSQGLGNPSRTTVDNDGSVWVANRNDVSNGFGTIVHIGLLENGQCEDRNGNGVIDTSTGLGDVKSWTDASGTRGVETADDECITHYTQVNSTGTRHISVDANNDVWVSGIGNRVFDLVQGGRYDVPGSGTIIRSEPSVGYGGYGGLIDPNGVIWSARNLLRWDVANLLTGPNGDPPGDSIGPPAVGTNWSGQSSPDSYGLCIDSQGNVWNTQVSGGLINKYKPDGTWLGGFSHGWENAQGCVVDGNDDVWVAHSIAEGGSNTVGHILNDGTYIGNVTLDPTENAWATGVAVDREGKIWATGYNSRKVYRIDPTKDPLDADGWTPVGKVDFTSVNLGGLLYNYSDMTGSTLIAPPDTGTWTIIYDSGCALNDWTTVKVKWASDEPGDSSIMVEVSSSEDGVTFGSSQVTANGDPLTVGEGQYLKVMVTFERSTYTDDDNDGINDSPILYDLTVECNLPPDCSQAAASIDTIWPPNHNWVDIGIIGVTDPDGDPVTITIDSINQDEPVDTYGDGKFTPDGQVIGTDTASVRAERAGSKKVPGNGRVYHIAFTASDDKGGECNGEVLVGVPHDQGQGNVPIDDGPSYDSTALSP
ncbi:hypothetical protein [Desulfobacula sp.]|uniref:hypothetical protein n=1 Tax=Desulfobacula sp. TaxID=2593537 RepID=UPI002632748E|nr:hypothetical protein [Desulfobacula sp.]